MLITADDRTGAAEVAGAIAGRVGMPVAVGAGAAFGANLDAPSDDAAGMDRVVDLNTRHLSPVEARAAIGPVAQTIDAHKIDSTLRGNWNDEVAALVAAGRRVLVVAALPAQGRLCIGGVVYEHGRPVHEGPSGIDPRRQVTTSSTTELLAAAGLDDVAVLGSVADIAAWQQGSVPCAVADVADAETLESVAAAWAVDPTTVVVGTSEAIAAAAATVSTSVATNHLHNDIPATFDGPALVVCGSLHPVAREQVAHIARAGVATTDLADEHAVAVLRRGEPLVLATVLPAGPIDTPLAIAAASGLARDTATLLEAASVGVVIIVGGDTAGAVIGDRLFIVESTVGAGMPIGRVEAVTPPVITRAGGFGSVDSLDRLVRYQLLQR